MNVLQVALALFDGSFDIASAGAGLADADHEDLGAEGLETMQLLEVVLQLSEQGILEVENPLAAFADRVLMVLTGDLVVSRAGAEADRPQGAGDREGVEGPIHGRARKAGSFGLDPGRDLVGGAVRTKGRDRVPYQAPLAGMALAHAEWRLSHSSFSFRLVLKTTDKSGIPL
jgi:hypothetical protein